MFELIKFIAGQTIVVFTHREYAPMLAKACELSRLEAVVFAVRRRDMNRIVAYCVRGERTTDPQRVLELITDPDLPGVLGLEPPTIQFDVVVDDPEPVHVVPWYDTLTVSDLRDIARDLDIPGRSGMNKDELIAAIESADSQPGPRERKAKPNKPTSFKAFPATVTAIDAVQGIVEAIVNVFGIIDDGDDIVHLGAFTKTLAENGRRVRVLDSHNNRSALSVVGRPVEIREVGRGELPPEILQQHPEATGGLYTKTQFLLNTPEGRGIFQRIQAGALNEYSIGFDALDTDMSKVDDPVTGKPKVVRNIRQCRLWEYSVVTFGMNQSTTTIGVKSDTTSTDAKPYSVFEIDNEYCVYKVDDEGNRTGEALGCHESHEDAVAQIAAIEASEQDSAKARKEMTPDGPVKRLGDKLLGGIQFAADEMVNHWLKDGIIDDAEHMMIRELATRHIRMIRDELPDDVALRDISPMDFFFMFGDDKPDMEAKATQAQMTQAAQMLRQVADLLASGEPHLDTPDADTDKPTGDEAEADDPPANDNEHEQNGPQASQDAPTPQDDQPDGAGPQGDDNAPNSADLLAQIAQAQAELEALKQ